MTKEIFEERINANTRIWDFLNEVYKMKIDLYNCPLFEEFCRLEKVLWEETYTEEGVDWIYWFMDEKMGSNNPEEMKAYDSDGNEICKNVSELYDFIEKYKK